MSLILFTTCIQSCIYLSLVSLNSFTSILNSFTGIPELIHWYPSICSPLPFNLFTPFFSLKKSTQFQGYHWTNWGYWSRSRYHHKQSHSRIVQRKRQVFYLQNWCHNSHKTGVLFPIQTFIVTLMFWFRRVLLFCASCDILFVDRN